MSSLIIVINQPSLSLLNLALSAPMNPNNNQMLSLPASSSSSMEVNPSWLQHLPAPYVDFSTSGSFDSWFSRFAAVPELANWLVQVRVLNPDSLVLITPNLVARERVGLLQLLTTSSRVTISTQPTASCGCGYGYAVNRTTLVFGLCSVYFYTVSVLPEQEVLAHTRKFFKSSRAWVQFIHLSSFKDALAV